ncbi:MAG: hypothetical protein ACRDQ2_08420, partial [Gaiellales bacterium]
MPVFVVNIMPNALSGETFQDSEPNLAVNPSNPLQIAASAFTRDPMGGANAPIYVSTDGGMTWALNSIVPSQPSQSWQPGTGDITVRFGTVTSILYAGILRLPDSLRMNILRATSFTAATPMTVLVDRQGAGVDQPYIQAVTRLGGGGAGLDNVYVGNNDFNAAASRTATVDLSLDGAGATPPPPSGFTTARIET